MDVSQENEKGNLFVPSIISLVFTKNRKITKVLAVTIACEFDTLVVFTDKNVAGEDFTLVMYIAAVSV